MTEGQGDRPQNEPASAETASALERLRQEIDLHKRQESSQSYLSRGLGVLYRQDDNSFKALEQLSQEAAKAQKAGDTAALSKAAQQVEAAIKAHREGLSTQSEVTHYASGFLKTAGLFLRGRIGLAGTVGLYALDQMNPSDSVGVQLLDGGLGSAKGGLLKGAFHVLGSKDVSIPLKGVGLGTASRILETGLTRSTYLDQRTGEFQFGKGLNSIALTTFNKQALFADAAIFTVAHGLLKGTDGLTHGAIEKSAFLKTALTGTTFGMSSGATAEIMRQQAAGEQFDLGKITKKALIQGALDTVAATPGGIQARNLQTRIAGEQLAAERALAGKLAADKLAADKLLADKIAVAKRVADQLAADQLAEQRAAQQAAKAERKEQRRAENEQRKLELKEERKEQERINRERNEEARRTREAADKERRAQERAAREQQLKDLEIARLAREKAQQEQAAAEKLAAETAAREKVQGERADWEARKRPPEKVWKEFREQVAGTPGGQATSEARGDKAQRELFEWQQQNVRPGEGERVTDLLRARQAVQAEMTRDGWVLVQTGKNSLADGAGMDYILANTRTGKYTFLDATLDPNSKANLPELRRKNIVVIELDDFKSPTPESKMQFLDLIRQAMREDSPLNLSDTPPPNLSSKQTAEQASAELARFRTSLEEKSRWLEFDAARSAEGRLAGDSHVLANQAMGLREYNSDLARVEQFKRQKADQAADPDYETHLAAFNDRVAQIGKLVLKGYFAKGEVMSSPYEAVAQMTVSDKQGRRFVYILAEERLYFEDAGGGKRYEIKGVGDVVDRVMGEAEQAAFPNGVNRNAKGVDRFDLKRRLASSRSSERLEVMKRLLERLSTESTDSLLGR